MLFSLWPKCDRTSTQSRQRTGVTLPSQGPPDPAEAVSQMKPHPDHVIKKPKSNQHSPTIPAAPLVTQSCGRPHRGNAGALSGGGVGGGGSFHSQEARGPLCRDPGKHWAPVCQAYRPNHISLLQECDLLFHTLKEELGRPSVLPWVSTVRHSGSRDRRSFPTLCSCFSN